MGTEFNGGLKDLFQPQQFHVVVAQSGVNAAWVTFENWLPRMKSVFSMPNVSD